MSLIYRRINTRSNQWSSPHLLQEAQQEVSGGRVVGEEATHGFMHHVGVQTAAGWR